MDKVKKISGKGLFCILLALVLPLIWGITQLELSTILKIILVFLLLMYIMLLTNVIESINLISTAKKAFNAKLYSLKFVYEIKIIGIIVSLIVFTLWWISMLFENLEPEQIFLAFSLITLNSFLNIVFASDEYIFVYNRIIPISSIENFNYEDKRSGAYVDINICTTDKEKHLLRIDRKLKGEFTNILNKGSSVIKDEIK